MLPQLERALIAGHNVVLLGERGQGKTRLFRSLVGLLDVPGHLLEVIARFARSLRESSAIDQGSGAPAAPGHPTPRAPGCAGST